MTPDNGQVPFIYEETTFQPEDWLDLTSPAEEVKHVSPDDMLLKDVDFGVREYPNGSKSGRIDSAFQLVPAQALALISRVLYEGNLKYGKENWYGLPIEDNINHGVRHIFAVISEMQRTNRMKQAGQETHRHNFTYAQVQELAHAACRVLFALEQVWDSHLDVRDQLTIGEVEDV